ncbi:Asp23/Gls24 family envelope stress response protein [Pectinatus cerevisiiphilus]|uniref:Putative alkaline shock family protein YloU n=1 Tax=Pectinatus cerevisiiphilus TaxID=86956 RepID=A0A4R3K2J7_9FIRM|nr:Asp23/Gls24 family envelope stress response protein [Pectinatus cerevisiiphilus]TCS76677.1 putative alkaline shock family protein YloU [Pectinatus cerevisiiphilus]
MDVIALVGPSGTGKSHRALIVAHENKADAIIDDGILIKDGKIIAGHSAKREASKIMAVRRAIFILPGHAEEVKAAIEREKPHRILVLATSENMAYKICKILSLPSISKIINIADIATKAEMHKAHVCRIKEGKHIIPVPTIELKPHFSGFLIDPIQSFFKKSRTKRRKLGEKSIVRPIFSYYGRLIIDDSTILSIVSQITSNRKSVYKLFGLHVYHVFKDDEDQGICLSFKVILVYGKHIPTLLKELQHKIKVTIEYMTGMVVQKVDITVNALRVPA